MLRITERISLDMFTINKNEDGKLLTDNKVNTELLNPSQFFLMNKRMLSRYQEKQQVEMLQFGVVLSNLNELFKFYG